jgi:hypothetical protein
VDQLIRDLKWRHQHGEQQSQQTAERQEQRREDFGRIPSQEPGQPERRGFGGYFRRRRRPGERGLVQFRVRSFAFHATVETRRIPHRGGMAKSTRV